MESVFACIIPGSHSKISTPALSSEAQVWRDACASPGMSLLRGTITRTSIPRRAARLSAPRSARLGMKYAAWIQMRSFAAAMACCR